MQICTCDYKNDLGRKRLKHWQTDEIPAGTLHYVCKEVQRSCISGMENNCHQKCRMESVFCACLLHVTRLSTICGWIHALIKCPDQTMFHAIDVNMPFYCWIALVESNIGYITITFQITECVSSHDTLNEVCFGDYVNVSHIHIKRKRGRVIQNM